MGDDVGAAEFTEQDRHRYQEKLRRCVDVLARMLSGSTFASDRPLTGMEIELNLVDEVGDPAMRNDEVLAAVADPAFQTELGKYNIEINLPPAELAGDAADHLEARLRRTLNEADARARSLGSHLVMIGILPTLMGEHMGAGVLSADRRYALLNEQILAERAEGIAIDIRGRQRVAITAQSIAPEAACTSVQLHLQVNPATYAAYWNAAQSIAGIQLALGANSPLLFGRELWRETRVPLFEQATDTRPAGLKAQGGRPRVWFGDRWVSSVLDQYRENLDHFSAILPVCDDEDPDAVLAHGDTPELRELRLHNGTIYRWNRPVYDVAGGAPHLRIENRVLPAGPTVVDILANAAFYYGMVWALAENDPPVSSLMSFHVAKDNFFQGAKDGIHARVYWPGVGQVPATEVVLRHLLPLAHGGLAQRGVDLGVRDRLLGIIEQRCINHINGAEWQVRTLDHLGTRPEAGHPRGALRRMLHRYTELMHTNEPVHTWPVPT